MPGRDELGELCISAFGAGPKSFTDLFVDNERRWAISVNAPARGDLQGHRNELPPLVLIPMKLGTLASAQLAAIGALIATPTTPTVGLASLGRSVVEACSVAAWLLDDTVTSGVRHRRAWLIWAVAEGNAALTAAADAGRTGAMSGSPQRLLDIETAIHDRLGVRLERSASTKPKDWRLDGVSLPGPRALVVAATARWFPGADGATLYSQVSRQAHSDVLVALAMVDETLAIPEGEGGGFVPTTLAFWGLTWTHVLSYVGLTSPEFDDWRRRMLHAIGRGDLVDP